VLPVRLDKRLIQNQLGSLIRKLRLPPVFDLPLQRLEVPLDPIHTNGQSIDQIEALAVWLGSA